MRYYKAFNDWLALQITRGVGTMECAYLFLVLAAIGFPGFHATATQYVQWISQTVIQLVMLSIIMVGQRLMSTMTAKHHAEITQLHADHAREVATLHASHQALHAKVDALATAHAPALPVKAPAKRKAPAKKAAAK